ncbi:MAG: glycosyltransferase family 2 protein [Armatimonadetes bacterium]|nr:glycosyltransferase family 2 protein [Armatimonadota bacterium]
MTDRPLSLTAVICTLNEEPTIGEVIDGVMPHVDCCLVVDGHSTDATREIAEKHGARVTLDNGRGKGAAIRKAIEVVGTDAIVFIDADGSHDPADIPRLYAPVAAGEADLVVGDRMAGGSDELSGTFGRFLRLTGAGFITICVNYRFNVRLNDIQNGFRVIRTDVARALDLRENGFTIEMEMVMKALKRGYRVKNVASHEYARKVGRSRIAISKVWFRFGYVLIRHLLW